MIPKCSIQDDGSILVDTDTPPDDAPFIGGIAVNDETGAVYIISDEPIVENAVTYQGENVTYLNEIVTYM